jgi:hypothetical protein
MSGKLTALFMVVLCLTCIGVTEASEPKPWTERITIGGDFRYRHESIFETDRTARHRHRIRARLAATGAVNDRISALLRLASGKGEPVSTNQDLGGGASEKPIWIDRAYLEFRPAAALAFTAGKAAVPLESTDLIWDSDLNLEGVAGRWHADPKSTGLFASGGGFWITESASQPDQGVLVSQLGYRFIGDKQSASLALGYTDYQNFAQHPVVGAARGNRTTGSGSSTVYVSDFNIVALHASASQAWPQSTVTLNGEYVVNTAVNDNQESRVGALIGIIYKQKQSDFDWELAYNYRRLAKDAAVGEFTDSDFIGGGTNGTGHSLSGALWPMRNTLLRVRYLSDRVDPFTNGADRSYGRLMADVEVKF